MKAIATADYLVKLGDINLLHLVIDAFSVGARCKDY